MDISMAPRKYFTSREYIDMAGNKEIDWAI